MCFLTSSVLQGVGVNCLESVWIEFSIHLVSAQSQQCKHIHMYLSLWNVPHLLRFILFILFQIVLPKLTTPGNFIYLFFFFLQFFFDLDSCSYFWLIILRLYWLCLFIRLCVGAQMYACLLFLLILIVYYLYCFVYQIVLLISELLSNLIHYYIRICRYFLKIPELFGIYILLNTSLYHNRSKIKKES